MTQRTFAFWRFHMLTESLHEGRIAPDEIKRQLERLQSSPLFSLSHRYPKFLNYIVNKTLEGHQDDLKERTIGVEAFGRSPDYDLNEDPIVRVTAGEVRKRLAQYYYEAKHQEEVRIELHRGSYIPDFKFFTDENTEQPAEPATIEILPPTVVRALKFERIPALSASFLKRVPPGIFLGLACLGAAAGIRFLMLRPSPIDEFWQPMINTDCPVLISVGSVMALVRTQPSTSGGSSIGDHPLYSAPVALADTIAISTLQQVLANHNKATSIQSSVETTFSDLQRGPVILVSGFNNPWTMRLTDPLKFHFIRLEPSVFEIQDRAEPDSKKWAINTLTPFTEMNHDFSLIARIHDLTTDQIILVSAGIGENGTIAAAEFLSTGKYFKELKDEHQLPRRGQNFEAVIETQIINGRPGPPRVVATYAW
jgi:hypothetical protein